MQKMPKAVKSYQGLLKDNKSCQNMSKDARSCLYMPKVAKRCQKVPKDAKRCQKLPKDASRCQKLPKRCQKMPKVAKSCQKDAFLWRKHQIPRQLRMLLLRSIGLCSPTLLDSFPFSILAWLLPRKCKRERVLVASALQLPRWHRLRYPRTLLRRIQ